MAKGIRGIPGPASETRVNPTAPRRRVPSPRAALLCLVVGGAAGCSHVSGEYVWVDAYREPRPPAEQASAVAPGDLLAVRVWNQDSMGGRVRVRDDGKISLPFVNDVAVAGLEPTAIAAQLRTKLKDFVVNPVVSVSLEERPGVEISVLGEVARPGVYKLDAGAGVLKALATAGGLTLLARRDRIFVLRKTGDATDRRGPVRVRFTYGGLTEAHPAAAGFTLRTGDVLVVE